MTQRSMPKRLALALLPVAAGCAAQTQSVDRPGGIGAATSLEASATEPGAWTYVAPGVDLGAYQHFMFDPPQVSREPGASFGRRSDEEVREIAGMFVEEARAALGDAYPVVSVPGPGTARLRFTILGVAETVPYVATASRVIPFGAAINVLSQGAGRGGTLTGSVTYGVEAFDSRDGRLVAAAVRRLTPGAFDMGSTLGTMDTARAVARDAAARLRSTLDSLRSS